VIDKSILADFAREEQEFPRSAGSFDRFVAWRTMKLLEILARPPQQYQAPYDQALNPDRILPPSYSAGRSNEEDASGE
jgi:hypothetical protein